METIAQALMERMILIHGPPKKLLSDNGTEFKNGLTDRIYQLMGIKRKLTTPYHPQSDGMVERFNRTLLRMLTNYVEPDQKNWDLLLGYVIYSYNTVNSSKYGVSPFEIVYARKSINALQMNLSEETTQQASEKFLRNEWLQRAEKFISNTAKIIEEIDNDHQKEIQRQKKLQHVPKIRYEKGNLAWMRNHLRLFDGAKTKLQPNFKGPYVVVDVLSEVNVKIRPVSSDDKATTIHIDNLKPWWKTRKQIHRIQLDPDQPTIQENSDDEAGEYEVEKVCAHMIEKRRLRFQVKWKGFKQKSWVEEQDMKFHHLVEKYFLERQYQGIDDQ